MIETLTVNLSAPSFSFLLYENVKNNNGYGQEGFLIGEIVERQKNTITDNDQRQVHVTRTIKINGSIPCPNSTYFYDGIGRVDVEKLRNFLGDMAPKVVAWYRYRSTSSFIFSFREILIHKQLANLFEINPDFFTCCLLISETSDNLSTHTWSQNFIRLNTNMSDCLPIRIANLSDSSRAYRKLEPVSKTFLGILKGLKINHEKSQGITIINRIQNVLDKHTQESAKVLAESEKRLFELQEEIKKLKTFGIPKNQSKKTSKKQNDDNINTTESLNNSFSEESTKRMPLARAAKITATTKDQKRIKSPIKIKTPEANRDTNTRLRKKT